MNSPVVSLLTGGRSGGAFGRIPRWLLQGFQENGVRFDLVQLDGPRSQEAEGCTRVIKLGTRRAIRSIGAWSRYLREERPRLALVSPESLAPYALLAGRRAGSKVVVPWETSFVTFGLEDFPLARRLTLPAMQKLTYRWAPWIAAVSSDVADDLARRLGEGRMAGRYRVLPNPFLPDESLGQAPDLPIGRFRYCALGRLTVHKGFDVLLEATARLVEQGRDVEVMLIGAGPRRHDLESQSNLLSLGDRVRFLGEIRYPQATLRTAQVLVHPARREGFGLAILEALAAGIPVIATTCPGGPKDILGGGRFGALVEPDDPDALAAEMARFHDDASLRRRLAAAGEDRIDEFRPDKIAARMIEMAAP